MCFIKLRTLFVFSCVCVFSLPCFASVSSTSPNHTEHPDSAEQVTISDSVDTSKPDTDSKTLENEIDSNQDIITTSEMLAVDGNAPQVAPNLDLKQVAPLPAVPHKKTLKTSELEITQEPEDENETLTPQNEHVKAELLQPPLAEKFILLGAEVAPNTSTRLAWSPDVTITGLESPTPVLVINGKQFGPTLCLTAAVHGDELNGIEIVRRIMYDIKPEDLYGIVIGIPIVNLQGFQRGSRYLPDRRDLNRYFPGDKKGSLAARIAYSLFNEVIRHCDFLVDIHTGSLKRNNLPQIRADMRDERVALFTEGFDNMAVVHTPAASGMLRQAAVDKGIPAVTLETGESMRIQESKIKSAVKSIYTLMEKQGMYSKLFTWGEPEPIYYQSSWVRAAQGGILFNRTDIGDQVKKGQLLGTVIDPITNEQHNIISPSTGRIIGIAVNQVVMPGFAAYHIGIQSSEKKLLEQPADEANAQKAPVQEDVIELAPE